MVSMFKYLKVDKVDISFSPQKAIFLLECKPHPIESPVSVLNSYIHLKNPGNLTSSCAK